MNYMHSQTVILILMSSMLIFGVALDHFYKSEDEKTIFPHLQKEAEVETDAPNLDKISIFQPSVSTVSSVGGTLEMDLYEFIDLVPVQEVNEIRERYYKSDSNVRKAYDFIGKYNYSFVNTQLSELIEVQRALRFFKRKNINLDEIKQSLCARFGPPKLNIPIPIETNVFSNSNGFYAMVDSILDEIPQDELVTLFFEKMETSYDFAEFFEWIGGNDFREMLNVLRFNKEVQRFVYGLRNNGADIIKVFNILKKYFGFGFKK